MKIFGLRYELSRNEVNSYIKYEIEVYFGSIRILMCVCEVFLHEWVCNLIRSKLCMCVCLCAEYPVWCVVEFSFLAFMLYHAAHEITQSTKSMFCFFGYLVCVVGDSRLQLAHIFSRSMTINRNAETVLNVLLWDISANREQTHIHECTSSVTHTRIHIKLYLFSFSFDCASFVLKFITYIAKKRESESEWQRTKQSKKERQQQ